MNKTGKYLIAAALIALAPMAFACDYPRRPDIPNGAMASKDEMIAASKAVKEYQAALQEYRACIDTEEAEAVAQLENPTEEELNIRESAIAKKYNASVDEEMLVVAQYNDAVVAYKAQSD